jgi:transposase-like protein
MHTIAKITPADYPDLLAAVDAGTSQRELARRYDCAPSLIARHVAKAKRTREPSERTQEPDLVVTAEAHTGSMREILQARIRDPKTSARDLASLVNSLAKLNEEQQAAERPSIFYLRIGTLIIEPEQRGPGTWRMLLRTPNRIEQITDGLRPEQAFALAGCWLIEADRRALGLDASPPNSGQSEPDGSTPNGAHPEPEQASLPNGSQSG